MGDHEQGRDGRLDAAGPLGMGDPEEDARASSDADQALSDLDRSHSEADQTASDADQEAADSDRDASDRDQAAADRDHARSRPTAATELAYQASRAERAEVAAERRDAAAERGTSAAKRSSTGRARTRETSHRDEAAFEDEVRRRTAERVEHERAVLAQAEEMAGAGSWEWDLLASSLKWSPGLYRICGLLPSDEGVTLEAALATVHPDDRDRVIRDFTVDPAGADELHSTHRHVRPDATVRHVETRARVDRDHDGAAVRIVGVTVDVTDRREVELARLQAERELAVARAGADEAIRAARDVAERANLAKSEFLSRMSHELRTPLNAILGFGQLLEMDELDERPAEAVEQILRGGRHLLGLIDGDLDISRIDAGTIGISVEPVEVVSELAGAVALMTPVAADAGIELELERGDGRAFVTADRLRLRQVMLNLLSNAVKYNRAGGSVSVTHSAVDGRVRIHVADTGRGIAEDRLDRLFLAFDRLGAEAGVVQGTGLGLALSRSLVEQMGGALWARRTLGEGSEFTLELPRATGPADLITPAAAQRAGREAEGTGPRTILYIEDNPSNARLVAQALAGRPEVQLVAAAQGSRGLDLARAHRPDLILLDLGLPDMHGSTVLARLQADPDTRDLPVVVLSADTTQRQIHELLSAGARAHLTTPLNIRDFTEVVHRHLSAQVVDD